MSMKDHFGLKMLQIMFMKCEIMEVTLKESENGQDHVVSY
jgi:hypothetical protein